MSRIQVAIIGSGNIGTDLMIKIQKTSKYLECTMLVGIDPDSEGLAIAKQLGIATTDAGIAGLVKAPQFDGIRLVFDATSASAHAHHDRVLRECGKKVIDLTPAALGPYVIPVVNLDEHLDAPNINNVTCGGQATIPMVFAVSRVAAVHYAEIIASVSSRSAGPGTRANIDEFTRTTADAIEVLGGASQGKAIIVLNPADPPILMRNTIFTLSDMVDTALITDSVHRMIAELQTYVPGYRLKQTLQFETISEAVRLPRGGTATGLKTSIFIEVEGAGHYLPPYAGNLDVMTSAALKTAERLVELNAKGVRS
jgi:acetaldehyde dehydrogenase